MSERWLSVTEVPLSASRKPAILRRHGTPTTTRIAHTRPQLAWLTPTRSSPSRVAARYKRSARSASTLRVQALAARWSRPEPGATNAPEGPHFDCRGYHGPLNQRRARSIGHPSPRSCSRGELRARRALARLSREGGSVCSASAGRRSGRSTARASPTIRGRGGEELDRPGRTTGVSPCVPWYFLGGCRRTRAGTDARFERVTRASVRGLERFVSSESALKASA